jgi:uncharacterized membrane protein
MRNLFGAPNCPRGHGKLRGYTIGSRLIVEFLLIVALLVTSVAASFVTSVPETSVLVGVIWLALLAGLVMLDFFVLSYRCSTCGLSFTRQELASHPPR